MFNINKVECDVVDVCNLKCVHCGHFTYACSKNTYSYEEFKNDINQLSKIVHIKELSLMGGEPLILGKSLEQYINVIRQSGICSTLTIQTNGIFIEKNEFIFSLADRVIVSLYRSSHYDKLKKWITENTKKYKNLEYWEKNEFFKIYDPNLTKEKSIESWENCMAKTYCNFLYKGKYWKCAQTAKLYLVHGQNLDEGFDIYQPDAENKLKLFLDTDIKFKTCDVCCAGLTYQVEPWREYED